jgi:hypothetical protein
MQRAGQSGELAAGDISTFLRAWTGGDQGALDKLTPVVMTSFAGWRAGT